MADQNSGTEDHKKKRERSPGYPGISLKDAIERARTMYQKEGKHPAPAQAVLSHWGYGPKSGTGFLALAALKKFNLIEDEGSGAARKVKLTSLAIKILHEPDEDARLQATQESALTPSIHSELMEKYGGKLPSEESFKYHLKFERHFSESGADEFYREFLDTISFAKLGESGMLPGKEADSGGQLEHMNISIPKDRATATLPPGMPLKIEEKQEITSLDEGTVIFRMPREISMDSTNYLVDWLELIIKKVKRSAEKKVAEGG
jgi:hypothetical protein